MATPPTLLNVYESANWIDDISQSKALMTAVAVQTGDVIVVIAGTEGNATLSVTENGSAAFVDGPQDIGNARVCAWTYTVAGNETITVSISSTSAQDHFGGCAFHYRGTDGVGIKNSATGTTGDPAVTLTGVSANSAIVMIVSDWNATTGTQTANTTIGSFTKITGFPGDGANYGVFAGRYPDVGSAGNKAIGMTVPDGQDWAIVGVEVKGTAGGGGSSVPAKKKIIIIDSKFILPMALVGALIRNPKVTRREMLGRK